MKSYILERLRCDARHVIDLAKIADKIEHQGLKGRFRELLIDNLLSPWMPPYVNCGTGTIIDGFSIVARSSTQDDIILYDTTLCPPVLTSNSAPEGIFLINSVLARIEVKSTLTAIDLKKFIQTSKEISTMTFSSRTGKIDPKVVGPFNLLFAFGSDISGSEIERLNKYLLEADLSPWLCIISMLCIVGKGFWKIGEREDGTKCWQQLETTQAEDYLVWFLGCTSSSCFIQHAARHGLDSDKSLDSGIGLYLSDKIYTNLD